MSSAPQDSDEPVAMLQIGEVAARVDLSIRTIRHWEEIGLIRPSGRSRGGFRLYNEEDVARIRLLRYMKPLNFTLEQMRELLQLRESAGAGRDGVEPSSALIWPRSSTPDDPRITDQLIRDLRGYADHAERRLAALRIQVVEVEDFVRRLRAEADREQPSSRPAAPGPSGPAH